MEAYLTVASILAGFGISVLMFRIQRELHIQEKYPDEPKLLVVVPLVALPGPGKNALALAAGSCAAAAILLAAYPLAILDHYRIAIGVRRKGERMKGEPVEKALVLGAAFVATAAFAGIVAWRLAL